MLSDRIALPGLRSTSYPVSTLADTNQQSAHRNCTGLAQIAGQVHAFDRDFHLAGRVGAIYANYVKLALLC
jgi:hypothetical protein